MPKTRIYVVEVGDPEHEWVYLVEATSKSQARNHIARELLACRVASQNDLINLLKDKIPIVDATAGNDGEVPNGNDT